MQQIITMMDSLVLLPDKVGGVQFCRDDISVASIEQSHTGSQELKGCIDMTHVHGVPTSLSKWKNPSSPHFLLPYQADQNVSH